MESGNRIEITDKDGWRKEFILQKRLVYIGSDPRNDIVLNAYRGAGVSPRHLQLVIAPGGSAQCSAVNLSAQVIPMGLNSDRSLDASSAMEVSDGEIFHMGEFTLVFHLEQPAVAPVRLATGESISSRGSGKNGSSVSIGLKVSLSQVVLSTEIPIEGMIYVANQGSAPGVQFRLGLDGLPPESYQIGPAPILFPGAEKAVPVRIFHPCRHEILAGPHQVTFWADAIEAYPGESAGVTRDIRILPFYSHKLRLLSVD